MSIYYKQEFISPNSLFAEVKEELSSYFASGAIDDVMFPRWADDCLKRFRKTAFKIEEVVLHIKDFKACLPPTFEGVREAWACTVFHSHPYESATAQYYQTDCTLSAPYQASCDDCGLTGDNCKVNYDVIHKIKGTYMFSFRRTFLLTPGNMHAKSRCGEECPNIGASTPYTFDIDGGNIVTNFHEGTIHLMYYSRPDSEGDQLIPDNWWFGDFLRKYIIFKCFSKLSNMVTDESFNQIMHKKQEAKQEADVAFIIAETEMKKQTVDQKVRAIRKSYEQNDKYRLPGDMSYGHRRRR